MREQFDQYFPGEPPRVRRVPGSPQSGKLLEEEVLATLLDRLDETSSEDCYPLQLSFYQKILQCDLLLPVPIGTQLQMGLPLVTLENPQGEVGLPIFTSEESLALWDDEPTEYVILPFSKLCGYAMEAQVDFLIVNVAGPHGCEIALRDFSYLAESLIPPPVSGLGRGVSSSALPVEIDAGTPTRIGTEKRLPHELMQRINYVLSSHGSALNQVYQFEIAFNEGPLQPALGVQLAEDPQAQIVWDKQLWPNLQAVLNEMLDRHTVVNVFLLNEVPSLTAQVRSQCQPMFVGSAGSGL